LHDVQELKRRIAADAGLRAFLADGALAPATVTLARAPGRLDVMGGVADYSGSLVAEMTIAEAALVALAPRADRTLRVWSLGVESEGLAPQVTGSLDEFSDRGTLRDYAAVHEHLRRDPASRWAAYVLGCFYVLRAEGVLPDFPHGANLILDSRVPLGAGVSSSAAIEVAAMQAIRAAYGLELEGVALARLAQTVENRVVGAPCGIMDQMTSALGVADGLLLILCQPHQVQGTQALPAGVRVFGINSDVKHSVGGGAYTRARVAAFMGRKLLSVPYLAQLSGRELGEQLAAALPTRIQGAEFLAQFGETDDPVTRINPNEFYSVSAATSHGVWENERVVGFVEKLREAREDHGGRIDEHLASAGSRMYASHDSYTKLGLGSPETDLLVGLGRQAGRDKGIYGAKITGGGSGGTVAFLTYGDGAEETIRGIAAEYAGRTGRTPQVVAGGLLPGAVAFGHETFPL
jgi:L-arabinokinase